MKNYKPFFALLLSLCLLVTATSCANGGENGNSSQSVASEQGQFAESGSSSFSDSQGTEDNNTPSPNGSANTSRPLSGNTQSNPSVGTQSGGGQSVGTNPNKPGNSPQNSSNSEQQDSPTTPPEAESQETPRIVSTKYPTADVVVADIVVTDDLYGADPTGKRDATWKIQAALYDCAEQGGGTVWLPAGKYRITDSITIPSFVTLRGDWQDPDKGNDYGTVIFADIEPTYKEDSSGLFYLGGSGGVMGLTVYYPNQSLSSVKPYPFTFYVKGTGDGYMLQSIVNCTVINGYKGIGACVGEANAHEQLTVENFKGTFLHCGAEVYNQADVGTWKNVSLNNKYWAEANTSLGMTAPSRHLLNEYTVQNTTGLILGDLEWTEFNNLKMENYYTGIHIVKGKRIEFAGSLFNVSVAHCVYGILADSMDARWGMVLAKSSIGGAQYAICNNSGGIIKMVDVQTTGGVKGSTDRDSSSLQAISTNTERTSPKPKAKLYHTNLTEHENISYALQALLDAAGENGGGVVYIPAGTYLLTQPITVPAGVELRGCSSVAGREQGGNSKGTLLLVGYGENTANPDSDPAIVTLNGKNAGVRGLRFYYPENLYTDGVAPYPYTIRGKAEGVYAVNVAISATYNGVDFRGCDNHLIQRLQGCAYNNMMAVGGKNGLIEGCLQNGTAIVRQGIPSVSTNEGNLFTHLFNPITRAKTEYIRIVNANGQTVFNTFAYGVKTLVVNQNSTNVTLVNLGADNIGGPLLRMDGGSLTGVNIMRWNGSSYQYGSGSLSLYNRLTINNKKEKTEKK